MGDKYSVLILDDENRIAGLLARLVHWEENGLISAGVYDDSSTALEEILKNPPDIVITDINMPVIDGLELVRQVKERKLPTQFILISGYREFEYAHRALQYGVQNYLLKPIKEQELNDTLRKIVTESGRKEAAERVRQEAVKRSRELLNRDAIGMLAAADHGVNLAEFNQAYGQQLTDDLLRVLILRLDHHRPEAENTIQDQQVFSHLQVLLEQQLKPLLKEEISAVRDNVFLYSILNYDRAQSTAVKKALYEAMDSMTAYIYGFADYELTAGLGKETDFTRLRYSMAEAKACLSARILTGTGKLIEAEQLHYEDMTKAAVLIQAETADLKNACDSFDGIRMREAVSRWMNELRGKNRLNPESIYESAALLTEQFFSDTAKTTENEKEKAAILGRIPDCYTTAMLEAFLKTEFQRNLDRMRQEKSDQSGRPVRRAVEYIEAHFAEKIVLEDAAAQAELNPSYFAVLFKKETGKTFLGYLTDFRIEKSKALLRGTNETMAAIAEQVGYSDTRYFSQCFEKTVGMKPSFYRRLYS